MAGLCHSDAVSNNVNATLKEQTLCVALEWVFWLSWLFAVVILFFLTQ